MLIPKPRFDGCIWGCVHTEYWLQLEHEPRFVVQLTIFKATFCQLKKVRPKEVCDSKLFSTTTFDLQRSLFVLTMKNNVKLAMQKPFDINPFTKLWRTFFSSWIFEQKIHEYIKSPELAMVQVSGSIEDE
jgi:hypothetical protein